MIRAAGVLYIAGGRALFLKRAIGDDHGGEWCLPGGGIDGGETPEEAVRREFEEETGHKLDGELRLLTRRIKYDPPMLTAPTHVPAPIGGQSVSIVGQETPLTPPSDAIACDPVDYTTYICEGPAFEPVLNDENVAYAWAPIDAAPEPLHPGCYVSLQRVTANELDIARLIARGDLVSPQKYQNVWLFALRISGTGVAYRPKLDEYVLRRPADYLSADFIARCNGLPILWQHPPSDILTSDEFSKRIIGTMFLPYVQGDEVWGIAKIYNDEAAQRMQDERLSTSPGVTAAIMLKGTIEIDNGESALVVEGSPTLADHLAICRQGVWDKGQEPQGVRAEAKGDSAMPEEIKKENEKKEDARKDAGNQGELLDRVLTGIDAIGKRLDAVEKSIEETRHDLRRKDEDGDEEKEHRKYADAVARGDAKKKGNLEGFEEGGVFHPICSSSGYSKRKAGDSDETYRARHDAEEETEKEELKTEGVAEKTAADRARRHRYDAEEEEEKERQDRAKKDAEEKERRDHEARKDNGTFAAPGPANKVEPTNTKADAMNTDIADRIARVEAALPKALDDADHAKFADAQARADSIYQAFGKHAPGPLNGETIMAYMRRLLYPLQKYSARWKDANLVKLATDSAAFGVVQEQIYADATSAATHPSDLAEGEIRMVEKRHPVTKLPIYEFVSTGGTFIGGMKPRAQAMRLNATPRGASR